MDENKKDSQKEVDVTISIQPTTYRNNEGNYIGNMSVDMNSKKQPSGLYSQVNHYLNKNLRVIENQMKKIDDPTKVDPKSLVPAFKKRIRFQPVQYAAIKKGGKTKSKKSKSRKSKSRKNKTK